MKQHNKIKNEATFEVGKKTNIQLSSKTVSGIGCMTDKNKNGVTKPEKKRQKLINLLSTAPTVETKRLNMLSLRERMIEKLKASRFRYINEQIYNSGSKEIQQYFAKDPHAFQAYHEGYRQQVSKWPVNPIDIIIKTVKKMLSFCSCMYVNEN